jgi:long-chain fatty acid transport protein
VVLLAAVSYFAPTVAYATNGLFMTGTGTKSRAMGGVGVATPLDSLSSVANPAVISGMDDRFDIGLDVFKPDVESQLGSVSAKSKASVNGLGLDSVFFLPHIGITYRYSSDISLGVAVAPTGGGGTKFTTNFYEAANAGDANAPSVNTNLGVDYSVGTINTSIAYKVNQQHSLGAALVIGIARFEAYGLDLFSSFTPSNTTDRMTDQGKDWSIGAGARVGWFGDFGDFKAGASYTSKIWMNQFDRYRELFAEGGRMNVPAVAALGASYQATPRLLTAMDVTYTFYEDTKAIGNIGPNLAGDPAGPIDNGTRELGNSNGPGFGWENQLVIKLGLQYELNEKWIVRGGWNYGASPINEEREIMMNLLAPATTEYHITLGGTYNLDNDMEINFSYIHAFENWQSGPTYISDDGSNYGRLQMSQNAIGGSFSMKY